MELSVVIPVYNSGDFLPNLLKHLEAQLSYIDNIILVDDRSTDDSFEIITEWGRRFRNVVICISKNKGASGARQEGLNRIKSGFVTFIDSDDDISSDYFANLKAILEENKGFDMYVLSYETYFSDSHCLNRVNTPGVFFDGKSYAKSIESGDTIGDMALWNHVYNVDFLKKNGIAFDLSAQIAEDSLFNDLCILNAESVFVTDYSGYMWINRQNSLTGRCPENMGETLRKHIDYCTMIKEKYELGDYYVYERKKWALSYLMNNIYSSRHPLELKKKMFNKALKENADDILIKSGYKGLERFFLERSYRTGNSMAYYLYRRYRVREVANRLLYTMVRLKKVIVGVWSRK